MSGLLLFSSLLSFVNCGCLFQRLGEDGRGKVRLGYIERNFLRLGNIAKAWAKLSEVWFGLTRMLQKDNIQGPIVSFLVVAAS